MNIKRSSGRLRSIRINLVSTGSEFKYFRFGSEAANFRFKQFNSPVHELIHRHFLSLPPGSGPRARGGRAEGPRGPRGRGPPCTVPLKSRGPGGPLGGPRAPGAWAPGAAPTLFAVFRAIWGRTDTGPYGAVPAGLPGPYGGSPGRPGGPGGPGPAPRGQPHMRESI